MNTNEKNAMTYASVTIAILVTQCAIFQSYFYTYEQAIVLLTITSIIALMSGFCGIYYVFKSLTK